MDGIRARGLTKRFATIGALTGVDLDVEPGSVVALLGENGAGKSTLIRILATTVLPDSGSASVAGHDVVADPHGTRAALGLMLGDQRWYARLSGRQNLEFFAVLYGLVREAATARAADLLAQIGLEAHADRPVKDYSSGMRARLALARALIREPAVLLLDEPTQNLDPVAAEELRRTIGDLARLRGAAVLLATHDLREAAAMASGVCILRAGAVAWQTASPVAVADLEERLVTMSGV